MKPLACSAETTLAEASKASISYAVTLGIKSVETLNGVPIYHCQWIGVGEPGCEIFPIAVVVVLGKVEERTGLDVVVEEVVVEIDW